MTAPAEATGHFEIIWDHSGATVKAAPTKTTICADLLDALGDELSGLRRVRDVVEFPGFVRYQVGEPHQERSCDDHPAEPCHVYLHRLDAGKPT